MHCNLSVGGYRGFRRQMIQICSQRSEVQNSDVSVFRCLFQIQNDRCCHMIISCDTPKMRSEIKWHHQGLNQWPPPNSHRCCAACYHCTIMAFYFACMHAMYSHFWHLDLDIFPSLPWVKQGLPPPLRDICPIHTLWIEQYYTIRSYFEFQDGENGLTEEWGRKCV